MAETAVENCGTQNPWYYFTKNDDGLAAKCNTCHKIIKTKCGNTSGLHCHLQKHNIQAKKVKRALKDISVPQTQNSVPPFFKKVRLGEQLATEQTLPAMLARMTAKSGLPFRVFETDEDLRFCIQAGLDKLGNEEVLPKSDKTIKLYVMKYGERVKAAVSESFRAMRSTGIKFSLTFDEWSSIANNRYINVIVFAPSKMHWSLGLIKITGRATAYRLMELILERLIMFGIDFNNDIVSITTDGASTMTKLGREDSLAQHHLCLIHGVHLAVVDILYVKDEKSETIACVENNFDSPENLESVTDTSENEEGFNVVELETTGLFHDKTVKDTIAKIRELGAHFKKSAINNETLQAYVKLQFNDPELKMPLMVDSKTRWNSLYNMLDRYWRIRDCVDKTLIDIRHKLSISLKEKYIISCILITLRPVMIVVKNLSCRDSTLVKARMSLIILFKQLFKQKNPLTVKFVRRLYSRIFERWNINYGVLAYLHTGSLSNKWLQNNIGADVEEDSLYDFKYDDEALVQFCYDTNDVIDPEEGINYLEMFEIPKRPAIKTHLVGLVKRLYQPNEEEDCIQPQITPLDPKPKSFEEILNAAMLECDESDVGNEAPDLSRISQTLTAEMSHLEKTRIRIGFVLKMYDSLMTTQPSSVESERAFSLASYLCSKLRSRLNDSTLDTLSFLRAFFRAPFLFEGNENDTTN